jgi:hypothetical protein
MANAYCVARRLSGVAPLLWILALGGCGGSGSGGSDPYAAWGGMSKEEWLKQRQETEKQTQRELEEARQKAEAAKQSVGRPRPKRGSPRTPAPSSPPAAPAAAPKTNPPVTSTAAAPTTTALSPSLPALPGNVANWSERDYLVARVARDPRLFTAIRYLATQRQGDENAARLLAALLQPARYAGVVESPPPAAGRRPRPIELPDRERIIDSAIDALAQNQTFAAASALGQLIAGRMETEDNFLVATTALDRLVRYPSALHDDMLFRILTAPEQIRAKEDAELTAATLQQQALVLAGPSASPGLRTRLAQHLSTADASLSTYEALERFVSMPSPDNLEAHVVMFTTQRGGPSRERGALERRFAEYSSGALARLLGIPQQQPRQRQTQQLSSMAAPEWPARVARSLWSRNFQLILEGQLGRAESVAEQSPLFFLAATIPADVARAGLDRALEKLWFGGPKPLDSLRTADDLVVDPGLVVLLKRRESEREGALKQALQSARATLRRTGDRSNGAGADSVSQVLEIHNDWRTLRGTLSNIWCERCRAAAAAHDAAERAQGRVPNWDSILEGLPLELHAGDSIVAAHRARWPDDLSPQDRLLGLAPLKLYYARMEQRAKPKEVYDAYLRALDSHERRPIPGGIVLETLVDLDEQRTLRSVDVRMWRAFPEVTQSPEAEQELIVEALVIEVPHWSPELQEPKGKD